MHHPTDRITHPTAVVRPAVEHWLGRNIAQWEHHVVTLQYKQNRIDYMFLPRIQCGKMQRSFSNSR